ncbi:MAG: DPP IV N-terminal domain-containing protein [Rubrivivax sp.]
MKLITKGNFDVISPEAIDEANGYVYFMASPANATQKYLYRAGLDGAGEADDEERAKRHHERLQQVLHGAGDEAERVHEALRGGLSECRDGVAGVTRRRAQGDETPARTVNRLPGAPSRGGQPDVSAPVVPNPVSQAQRAGGAGSRLGGDAAARPSQARATHGTVATGPTGFAHSPYALHATGATGRSGAVPTSGRATPHASCGVVPPA